MPDALKDGLLSGAVTEGHCKALLGLDDTNLIVQAYKVVLKDNLGVRATEELARKMKSEVGIKPRTAVEYERTEELDRIEKDINAYLNMKAKVLKSARGGRITIFFKTGDDLNLIYTKLTNS